MRKNYIKFPSQFFDTKEWQKPRKYSKAEALLFLLSDTNDCSIGRLAKVFDWSKSTVHSFLKEMFQQGFIERLPNDCRTTNLLKDNAIKQSAERLPNDCRTHLIKDNYYPPILSSTKVESNIIPPKGEGDFLQELDVEYQDIVREWFTYKRERKESYKSVRSMQAFVAKLTKLSQGNPKIAKEIINQSMANNWAGIFQLKLDQRNDNQPHTDRPSSTIFIGSHYGQSTI